MATVQLGCFSLVNDYRRSAAASGNLNLAFAKIAKSEFSPFRTFFQENESTSAINTNIQVSIGWIKRIAAWQISLKLVNVVPTLVTATHCVRAHVY